MWTKTNLYIYFHSFFSFQLMWQQCTTGTVCCPTVRTVWPRLLLGLMPASITPRCPLAQCQHLPCPVLPLHPAPYLSWILRPQSHQPLPQFLSQWRLLPRSTIPPLRTLLRPGLHATVVFLYSVIAWALQKQSCMCFHFNPLALCLNKPPAPRHQPQPPLSLPSSPHLPTSSLSLTN